MKIAASADDGNVQGGPAMAFEKKTLQLTLDQAELIDLARVLIDGDAEGALAFLRRHVRGHARDLLEGG
jgi:hypothetical protein